MERKDLPRAEICDQSAEGGQDIVVERLRAGVGDKAQEEKAAGLKSLPEKSS